MRTGTSGVLVVLAAVSGACSTEDTEAKGPGKVVPGPCEAARLWDVTEDREFLTCDFDYNPAAQLSAISYFRGDINYSDMVWTYDGDGATEIRVERFWDQSWFETLWTFESDRVTWRRTDFDLNQVTDTAEFGLDHFAFIGSPFECEPLLTSSETILRAVNEGNEVAIDYSYEGSFESGMRGRTGVDSSTGEVVSTATFEYDREARLVHAFEELADYEATSGTSELTIDRDEAGRILQQTDNFRFAEGDEFGTSRTYRYDEFGNVLSLRLVESKTSADDIEYDQTYSYDCW